MDPNQNFRGKKKVSLLKQTWKKMKGLTFILRVIKQHHTAENQSDLHPRDAVVSVCLSFPLVEWRPRHSVGRKARGRCGESCFLWKGFGACISSLYKVSCCKTLNYFIKLNLKKKILFLLIASNHIKVKKICAVKKKKCLWYKTFCFN